MTYVYYGNYDALGVSDLLNIGPTGNDIKHVISQNILDEIKILLPENQRTDVKHPEYLADNDIHIKSNTHIQVVYITNGTKYELTHGNSAYNNAFGYFIYDTNNPPVNLNNIDYYYMIFPSASNTYYGGGLTSGDTIQLASEFTLSNGPSNSKIGIPTNFVFPAGKSIGFMLGANSWVNNKVVHGRPKYYSRHDFNGERGLLNKYHTVSLELSSMPGTMIVGFEDLDREWPHCDHDFNDLVIMLDISEGISSVSANYNDVDTRNLLTNIPNMGSSSKIGYKKVFVTLQDNSIVEAVATLAIPSDAITIKKKDGKLRTNKATVISISGVSSNMYIFGKSQNNYNGVKFSSAHSKWDGNFTYTVGQENTANINTNVNVCGEGIHYFSEFGQAVSFQFS